MIDKKKISNHHLAFVAGGSQLFSNITIPNRVVRLYTNNGNLPATFFGLYLRNNYAAG